MEELKLPEIELPKFVLYLHSKFRGELQDFFHTKERMQRLLVLAKKTFKHDHGIYTVSDPDIQMFHGKALEIVIDSSLWEMTKTGEAEVLIGEDGDFFYKLTDKGKKSASKLLDKNDPVDNKIKQLQAKRENLKEKLQEVNEKIKKLMTEICEEEKKIREKNKE